MGKVLRIVDGLRNAITGMGTSRDARMATTYGLARPLTQQEIHAAYSTSGLMRKIVRIPALDMTRECREWEMERDQIEAIEAEEDRLGLARKLFQAEVLRGLGGGALILGLPGNPSEVPPKISKRGLVYLHVVSRWHLSFTQLQDDAREPGYGEPIMWRMQSDGRQVEIHPSRVITFRADSTSTLAAPSGYGIEDAYWGESVVQQVLDAVKDCDTARASFAALMHKARLTRIGIPNLTDIVSTPDGEKAISARLETMALAESMYNAAVYDAGIDGQGGEKIDDVSYSFAGAKDILTAYAEFVSAISDIPATRLLGRAPEGMNSSGDSQQKDWAKKVRAMQTLDLKPCLHQLDAFLIPSALGSMPGKVDWDFAPLEAPDEDKEATRFKTVAEALTAIANMGVMPEQAFNEAAQNTLVEGEWMPGLGQALAKVPEAERFGIVPDPTNDPSLAPPPADPNQSPALPRGGDPAAGAQVTDAAPRTLYVMRPVLNRAELQRWATAQGLGELQPDLHVTIAASRQPVDWMEIQSDTWAQDKNGNVTIPPGGVRIVEPLGSQTAVLLFTSSCLTWRHEEIKRAGASWDFDQYQPHVSLTADPVDLSAVEPYRGAIELGPEVFEEFSGGAD